MFDVYLNGRLDLLVVRKGFPIPLGDASCRWRKRKRRVASVSEEIRRAVQKQGYYMRKQSDAKGAFTVPDHRGEPRGQADPSEGNAGDPEHR